MTHWINSSDFAGYRSYEYSNGRINDWLNNPGEDLYIRFMRGKMAGTTVRVIRDESYDDLWKWFYEGNGFGQNLKLRVWDGEKELKVRFVPDYYVSKTVGGSALFYICNDFDPEKPELGAMDDDSILYPLRQDMFGIDIEIGSVIHVQIYNMGVFAVVEGYNPKSIQIKPIEWNDTLVEIFQGKSMAWNRNTNECFVVDKELPDRLLLARLTGSSE